MPETDVLKKLEQVTKTQDEILDLLKDISRAFPRDDFDEPDYDGHRKYHQQLIRRAVEADKDRQSAVQDVVKKGLWAGLALMGYAIWEYITDKIRRGGQ